MLCPTALSKSTVILVSLFLLSLPAWGAADQQRSVEQILQRMSLASRELDYQGIFTYEYSGVMKSVKVTHVVHEGVGYEHWYYLSGPRQEVMRSVAAADCPSGDSQARGLTPLPHRVGDATQLHNYYELHLRGEDRIADRAVWVIHIVPRDRLRYGYVFAVDQQAGLLLQSLLLDSDRRVLERFQYMHIAYGVAPEDAQAVVSQVQGEDAPATCVDASAGSDPRWQAAWLPEGFAETARERNRDGVETLLFSDGLSVFSIFFDPEGGKQLPPVQAQRGATVAQMARVEAAGRSYLVSVVGEIPIETAQRVAGFVKYGNE